ncbi:MAG: hypothetical protein KDA80_03590 [Planctomycetaceae bacterium]|nr:hypothetical protein [Planctomycetaceae bacterium]
MAKSAKFKETSKPLLSASTILILSGFLIGLTVGRVGSSELSPYLLACGLSGCLAYIALDTAAARRAHAAWLKEKEQFEERFDRHMLSVSSLNLNNSSTSRELESLESVPEDNLPLCEEDIDDLSLSEVSI